MNHVTLQFVGTDSFTADIIELKGGGKYSHVDVIMPDGGLLGARNESIGGKPAGVQIRFPNYEKWESIAHLTIQLSDAQYFSFMAFLREQLGKPYDNAAIFGFVFNRDWREQNSWFCSELVVAAFEAVDNFFEYKVYTPANKIDPVTAFTLLSAFGVVEIIK